MILTLRRQTAWVFTRVAIAAMVGCAGVETARGEAAASSQPAVQMQPAVRVTDHDQVELHVVDVPLTAVLRMLSTQTRQNIIASASVQGTVTADLFDVTFREALDSILSPNGCGYIQRGNFIYVYTLDELAAMRAPGGGEKMVVRVFHLNYVSTEDVKPMIEVLKSKEGTIATMPDAEKSDSGGGGGGGGGESGGSGGNSAGLSSKSNKLTRPDAIVVYDYAGHIAQMEKVIRELDVRPKQVLVEATILRASLGEQNALGIDFNVLGGVNFEELGSTSSGVTSVDTGDLPTAQFRNTSMTFRNDLNQLMPRGGFTFGIIKDHIGVFLRALEQVTDATILANPKVLTLNKQEGYVIVGRRDGYITTTITETAATQTVEFLETGTQLYFRPFVSSDGFIRMEIHPEDSSGGLNEQNLPFKRTTEVTTNIMVRDGHTILIGGLFREANTTNRSQIPLVGNIPVAGALFQQNADDAEREEVIILLTVHVVNDDAYAKASEDVGQDIDRLALGMRKGLQPYGRNRLAQAHYRWAMEHLQEGQPDRALWDTRMALHLSPTLLPALRLKEQLLAERETEGGEAIVRDFIRRSLLKQRRSTDPIEPPASMPAAPMPGAPMSGAPMSGELMPAEEVRP